MQQAIINLEIKSSDHIKIDTCTKESMHNSNDIYIYKFQFIIFNSERLLPNFSLVCSKSNNLTRLFLILIPAGSFDDAIMAIFMNWGT